MENETTPGNNIPLKEKTGQVVKLQLVDQPRTKEALERFINSVDALQDRLNAIGEPDMLFDVFETLMMYTGFKMQEGKKNNK
jgi:hypothetical protein